MCSSDRQYFFQYGDGDVSFAESFVAVFAGVERGFAVVHVDERDLVHADEAVEGGEVADDVGGGADVARGEDVAGVDTEAEVAAIARRDATVERGEFLGSDTHLASLCGRRFEDDRVRGGDGVEVRDEVVHRRVADVAHRFADVDDAAAVAHGDAVVDFATHVRELRRGERTSEVVDVGHVEEETQFRRGDVVAHHFQLLLAPLLYRAIPRIRHEYLDAGHARFDAALKRCKNIAAHHVHMTTNCDKLRHLY